MDNSLEQQVERACRHLLSEENRDPYTPTYGCFDRRYWGWKLIDFPEATFQRNVYPLAWKLGRLPDQHSQEAEILQESVLAGLGYAIKIQHKDGSFDQAFPNEHSFGATAFLISPLLKAYKTIQAAAPSEFQQKFEKSLLSAADFLCQHNEEHGHIANHLAGAALSLFETGSFFNIAKYEKRALEILNLVLENQSPEGWYLEYEGADPGYQTLCIYYLAQIYEKHPNPEFRNSLEKAIKFISYFIHPDGTFGGEYGARRTAVFYPGGLAILSKEFPLAHAITKAMFISIAEGTTVTLQDVDMGNFAPLLSNYICALDAITQAQKKSAPALPREEEKLIADFPKAGIYLRGTKSYYSVLGVSNGGVLKVFDKKKNEIIWDDSGYLAKLSNGSLASTQMTILDRPCTVLENKITLKSDFYAVLHSLPTPFKFLLLRILNLSLMRSLWLGNLVKNYLVKLLIDGKRPFQLSLRRAIIFEDKEIVVKDHLTKHPNLKLEWLKFGHKFVSIHMASSRYFDGHFAKKTLLASIVDLEQLNTENHLETETFLGVSNA